MIFLPEPLDGISIYIHIPLCENLCPYCHFYRVPPGKGIEDKYLDALTAEMDSLTEEAGSDAVRTIYVGGGTPTLLSPPFYSRLFKRMEERYDLSRVMESTIETDGRVREVALPDYVDAGFNRVSIGVKAFSRRHLEILGAGPPIRDAHGIVGRARGAGFSSVSVDLLYGFEGQREDDLREDLETAVLAGADHISLYALQGKEGKGPREALDDETAGFYRELRRSLIAAGYGHYEISNFAREGHECVHNVNYWCDGDFLGLGPSAHSAVTTGGTRRRWRNRDDLEGYMAQPAGLREALSSEGPEKRPAEALMMALRRTGGVKIDDFTLRYGVDPRTVLGPALREFKAYGLLRTAQNRLRLTTRGMLLSNELFVKLI